MNPFDFDEPVYMPDLSILGWEKDESYDGMKDKPSCDDKEDYHSKWYDN